MSKVYKNAHPDGSCCSPNIDHNKYGDLCGPCQCANQYHIQHSSSETTIYLDAVFPIGPSILTQFYMETNGEKNSELPLFLEEDVSLITVDNVVALRYPKFGSYSWPLECALFFRRKRKSGWPSRSLIHAVVDAGCYVVPKGNQKHFRGSFPSWFKFMSRQLQRNTWRVSFSSGEKILVKSMSQPQKKCFLLLKVFMGCGVISLNEEIRKCHSSSEDEDYLNEISSFLLKHVMFWTMEEIEPVEWRLNNLFSCLLKVLQKLECYLQNSFIPHYFYGDQKNILQEVAEEKDLQITIDRYLQIVQDLMSPKNIVTYIRKSLLSAKNNQFDYIWNSFSDHLGEKKLIETYSCLLSSVSLNETKEKPMLLNVTISKWNEKLVEHYKSMITVIEQSPRRYGAGVNTEYVKLLQNEMKNLVGNPFYKLDAEEKAQVLKTISENVPELQTEFQDGIQTFILDFLDQNLDSRPNTRLPCYNSDSKDFLDLLTQAH